MPNLTQRYAEALWPDQVKILGRPMQPYCIGHALLLHRVGSPFVCGRGDTVSEDNGVGDLLLALWICSRTWQKAAAGLAKRRVRWLLRFWGWQLRRRKAALAVVSAETQFARYIAQAWDGPQFWERQRDCPVRRPGAPVLAGLKVRVMAVFGCAEEEALSRPIRAALFEAAAWEESQGSVEIVAEDELAFMEATRN